jgi:dTDP-4-amino-4,6-dideoxygalactose transaminase
MYKKYTYQVKSGTEALIIALHELSAKKVIIPSYTCLDILNAVNEVGCEYHLSDCGLDLQIDVDDVFRVADDYDTIIIPHMFGIRADVKTIKEKTNLKIIEDLSQCHGLVGLGKYADIVISSTNKSKWIDFKRGGFVFSDKIMQLPLYNFDELKTTIQSNLIKRTELSTEIKNAGVNLIGNESSWLRGMYFTDYSKREPYIPLHKIVGGLGCYKINSYIGKVDWVSIIV